MATSAWIMPDTAAVFTPNTYAIMKDVWVLEYREQCLLDEYFIMQSTKARLEASIEVDDVMKYNYIVVRGNYYKVVIKGKLWETSKPNSRWLLSFRHNRHNNFAVVLAKPVNEAYGCPDYKHFPVGA